MDKKRIIGEVAARHGVRLDEDDPAIILVTLTELMLQEARVEFEATARQATAELLEAAERVQCLAGAASARAAKLASEVKYTQSAARPHSGKGERLIFCVVVAVSEATLFLAGIWVGKLGLP